MRLLYEIYQYVEIVQAFAIPVFVVLGSLAFGKYLLKK